MHKTTHSSYEFIHFLIIENSAIGREIIGVKQKSIMVKIVGIRLPTPVTVGDYVEKKLIHILPRLGEESVDKMDKKYLRPFTVQFDQNPTYRYPFPWHMVWWIIGGVVFYIATIVISVFCTHLSIRSNITSGKVPAVKRLKKSKHLKQEEEVLLQM